MEVIRRSTPHVMGLTHEGSRFGGNPSPMTAYGVFCGIRAALRHRYGSEDMAGLKVAVQGLGAVGYELCRLLDGQGAALFVTDVNNAVLEKAGRQFSSVSIVAPDEIFGVRAQVFAPCALGAQLNAKTIPQMHFEIIAGAANNQLETLADGDALAAKGILYAPDYAINAGGVIAVGYEYFEQVGRNPFPHEMTRENMIAHIEKIGETIEEIFRASKTLGISPGRAANQMAEAIFKEKDCSSLCSCGAT